jgi:uncharacterized protein (TIGR00106 family)
MVLIEFAMAPRGVGDSLSAHVARILDIIDKSGLAYQMTPMGTIVEGEWDQAMAVVDACFKALETDCPRIGVSLKADWKKGGASRLRSKVESVEKIVGRKLAQ